MTRRLRKFKLMQNTLTMATMCAIILFKHGLTWWEQHTVHTQQSTSHARLDECAAAQIEYMHGCGVSVCVRA